MNTRNIVTAFSLAVLIFLYNCSSRDSFEIKGSFKKADPTPVKIFYLSEESSVLADSVFSQDGDFELKGEMEKSGIYLMKFFNDQMVYLVIHPGDRIEIDIDNAGEEISYYVENSPDSKRIKQLHDKQHILLKRIDELSGELEQNRGNMSVRQQIDSVYRLIMSRHKEFTLDFIYSEPNSLSNILALYQNFGRGSKPLFDKYEDFETYNYVDSNLVIHHPDVDAVKALNKEVNSIRQQIEEKKYIEKVVEEGTTLPSFRYPGVNGDTITIAHNSGKPVLLFFWATWNRYSADEISKLNSFVQTKEGSDITVVSISLDTSGEKLQEFISSNHLVIPVVCDYSYWDSEITSRYAVKQIPSSILTDKKGVIIAIDIFDKELQERITGLTKK